MHMMNSEIRQILLMKREVNSLSFVMETVILNMNAETHHVKNRLGEIDFTIGTRLIKQVKSRSVMVNVIGILNALSIVAVTNKNVIRK